MEPLQFGSEHFERREELKMRAGRQSEANKESIEEIINKTDGKK